MSQYRWLNCPQKVRNQVNALLIALCANLDGNLTGIYLHGSLAMECFNPKRSDIDILVISRQRMIVVTKRSIANLLLHSSMAPSPIEISFLVEQDIQPFQHPLPFDMHYSEQWREKYQEELANGEWMKWNDNTLNDIDLSAHLTVTRKRGICLYGRSIQEAIPVVPSDNFSASIIADYKDARDAKVTMPVYFVLNACRIYAYLQEGRIFSKDEGGVWALQILPKDLRELVAQALDIYKGTRKDGHFDEVTLARFAIFMDEGITKTRLGNS